MFLCLLKKNQIKDIRNEIRSYMVARGQTYSSVASLLREKF